MCILIIHIFLIIVNENTPCIEKINKLGLSPSGKAQDFDSWIREFKSLQSCYLMYSKLKKWRFLYVYFNKWKGICDGESL